MVCIEHTAVCKKIEPDDVIFGVGKNHVWFCTSVHKDNGGASFCNSVSFVFTAACKSVFHTSECKFCFTAESSCKPLLQQ